jgi:hypothetical protein
MNQKLRFGFDEDYELWFKGMVENLMSGGFVGIFKIEKKYYWDCISIDTDDEKYLLCIGGDLFFKDESNISCLEYESYKNKILNIIFNMIEILE